ncbi:endospore germination permease [Peribacillus sp. TH16]|uniref:GerAB/ArcD/ProY family transporter n=1 Tax=Peribacillus TaxID=2675229 RepID=UPI001914A3E4|nr:MULTISPECIES: endospore germination permease [unclassified Peribacillus]MBK5446133.1 endospore germination permease [Peribacillus sp. TH24]MBK5459193.1 endospore germination permease [Peribacillus sp. TH27]MBK5481012.1 endospore germination permease [Peribacillus sp. TH16]WMX57519.1 endospore germination permease [Peribacillus sp. R9-11]
MLEKGKIGSRQLTILVILYTVGDSILVIPSIVASEAKQNGWVSGIFSVAIAPLLVVFLYDALRKCYPDLTLVEYSQKILGKWLGIAISLLFISYFFITTATYLREIGDFMTSQIMPETPIQVIMFLFMSIVLMSARLGLEPLARSAEILFPFVVILLSSLMILLLPEIKFQNLQPVWEGGVKPVIRGSIPFIVFPFIEPVAVLMILPFVSQKDRIRKSLFVGQLLAGSVLIIITMLAILVLGVDLTAKEIYPSYKLAQKINIANFLTRLEAILAIIWFITIFIRFSLFFYVTVLGLAQTLKLQDYRPLVFPFGMILIVFTLIMAPNTVYYSNFISDIWPFYAMTFGFLLPLLLLTIAKVHKK